MRILNFGSLNIDYVYEIDQIVRKGETKAASTRRVFPGGKGLNQSVALARAGCSVWHAGCVGEKDGQILLDTLKASGVQTEWIKRISEPSGHAIIQKDWNGDNSIILYGGANRKIKKESITETLSAFGRGDMLILQNEINNLETIIMDAKERGMDITLNPSPAAGIKNLCCAEKIDRLILNEIEACDLVGISTSDPERLIYTLKGLYINAQIVLTMGEKGAVLYNEGKIIYQEIYETEVVDTTAAGDTFTGYFIAAVLHGYSEKGALETASRAAAIAVSREGASTSIPWKSEVADYAEK